jgi:hypothetical protein
MVVSRIDFDLSMILDYLLPDSLGDVGAILFWVLTLLLVFLVIVDLRLFFKNRKTPETNEPQYQSPPQRNDNEITNEEREQAYVDVRMKVDHLLETHKL